MKNVLDGVRYRFNKFYLHRFFVYLGIMVIVWVLTFLLVKFGNNTNSLNDFPHKLYFNSLFIHNTFVNLRIILMGIIPIPLYFLFIIINAATVGAVLAMVNHPILMFFAGIVPHGIFEISSQLIAAAISARLVWFIFNKLFRKNKNNSTKFKTILKDTVTDTLVLVLPLTLVAALIETYVTPILINLVPK